jgi:hypothetical protein
MFRNVDAGQDILLIFTLKEIPTEFY